MDDELATLVGGATGFIGSHLVPALLADGRRVLVWARTPAKARAMYGRSVSVVGRLDEIGTDVRVGHVVNLTGERVLGLPWTAARRRQLVDSRVQSTGALVQWMRTRNPPPQVLVCASAVGYYGVPPQGTQVDESAPPQPGHFQSDLCAALEHAARQAEPLGVRVVRLRFAIVLGHGGGAYPQLALASRFGLGALLDGGGQPMPWVHVQDVVGMIRFVLDRPGLDGAVNVVAPQQVTQREFADALAHSLHRPRWLWVPGVALRMGLGEMSELLLQGQRVRPRVAQQAGYEFRYSTLAAALQDLAAAKP
jgi:uncharacterized protein (TIGR01777 family)